jgi:hypothetical protein
VCPDNPLTRLWVAAIERNCRRERIAARIKVDWRLPAKYRRAYHRVALDAASSADGIRSSRKPKTSLE